MTATNNTEPNEQDRRVNTNVPVDDTAGKRQPHERDESPEIEQGGTRTRIEQAARDIDAGLVDTDLREERGIQKAPPAGKDAVANPLPEVKKD
jgi:hypothetical protein